MSYHDLFGSCITSDSVSSTEVEFFIYLSRIDSTEIIGTREDRVVHRIGLFCREKYLDSEDCEESSHNLIQIILDS